MQQKSDAVKIQQFGELLFKESLPTIYELEKPRTTEEELAVIEKLSESKNSMILIAEHEKEIIGVIHLWGVKFPQSSHVGSIGITVHSDYRSKGVGSALFHELFNRAVGIGIKRIELEVFSNNHRAIKMYEKSGFKQDGCRSQAVKVGQEFVDSITMSRRI